MHRLTVLSATMFCLSVAISSTRAQEKPPAVWIEAETPTSANIEIKPDARRAEIVSGGKSLWFILAPDKAPADGILLKYDFSAPEAGQYELWARLGFEWVRSPLDWKIDNGEWKTYGVDETTTNVVEISTWNELAWGKLGPVDLAAGKHTLEIRCSKPSKNKNLMLALDCFALVKGEGKFVPELGQKPGEQYSAQVDKDAAAKVYRFAEGSVKPGAQRIELPLDGVWQVARYDDPDMNQETYAPLQALPPAGYPLRWMGLEVPGDAWTLRPELVFGSRILYQTRINVPTELKGRSFVLHFSGTNWIASVFVNGQYAGGRQSMLVPWDLDISKFVKPGQDNVLTVAIKGPYYAIDNRDPKIKANINGTRNIPRTQNFLAHTLFLDAIYPSSKGEGNGTNIGLVNPVKLVVTGPAYTFDVYIKPSVAKKRLDADVEITNPGDKPMEVQVQCEAVHDQTGKLEKAFPPVAASIPAGQTKTVAIGGDWAEAKLWWPGESAEDLPDCYQLRTTILAGGQPVDVRNDLFGFREITIKGKDFILNGIPWHFYNWVDVEGAKTDEDWLQKYHAQNDRFHRFSNDHSQRFGCREKAIEWLDRHGISARASTSIDGMFITHNARNPLVWKNFENHLRQVVKAYRNHPSILHWSIENEFMLVTIRNIYGGEYEQFENEMFKLGQVVAALDSTRPWYSDGGGDLGGQGPVNCQHYYWSTYNDVPRELYDFRKGPAVKPRPQKGLKSEDLYLWDGQRPLVGGEEFYYAGSPANMAWFGGPEVYRGKRFANLAATRYGRMAIEGARWQGEAGMCPWTVPPTPDAIKAFAPQAVFVREYNSTFYPASTLTRKIAVFNEGRIPQQLTLKWKLLLGGKEAGHGEKAYDVQPGTHQEDTLTSPLPKAEARVDGELQLELYAQGKKVFEDTKPVSLLPSSTKPADLDAKTLGVFDPEGKLAKWLAARQQTFTKLDNLDTIPAGVQVVLVGPDALSEELNKKAGTVLREFVLAGNTAIVLEQKAPLQKSDLPVAGVSLAGEQKNKPVMMEFLRQGGKSGAICHPVAPAHPILAGLKPADFFTWSGPTETNYRLSYASPTSGSVNLIQAGEELSLTPMMELPVGSGSYLLSQMTIGEKLNVDPAADQLMANLLNWAALRKNSKPGKTTLYAAKDAALSAFMDSLGLELTTADSPAEALAGDARVAVIRAKPEALLWLKEHLPEVQAFCDKGGWIMLVGVDKNGLATFNSLVGVEHRLRPFHAEKATLDQRQDPLLLGLSDRELSQNGPEKIAPWMGLHRVSDKIFTGVIDAGADIGSFSTCQYPVLFDGLNKEDFWRYTQYLKADGSQTVEMKFDQPQKLSGMTLWLSDDYYMIKDLELTFDDQDPVRFTLKETVEPQELAFPPREASKITLKVLSKQPGVAKQDFVTIGEIELNRALPADWNQKVVALSKPNGIVKYPIGKGGIVLNQIDYTEKGPSAEEVKKDNKLSEAAKIADENLAKKKTIFSALLRNMGAAFKAAAIPPAPVKPEPKKDVKKDAKK